MRAYLRSVGFWLIVNGTTTAPTDPAELAKWTLSDSMANGAIESDRVHFWSSTGSVGAVVVLLTMSQKPTDRR